MAPGAGNGVQSSREGEKEEKGHSPATPDIGRKQEDQINPRAERLTSNIKCMAKTQSKCRNGWAGMG